MSYDLMVFDPAHAPRGRTAFLTWVDTVTQADPVPARTMSGALPDFYAFLTQSFPDMNGEGVDINVLLSPPRPGFWARLRGQRAQPALKQARLADYACLPHAVYIGFDWTQTDAAQSAVLNTAQATGVGFYDASGQAGSILHDAAQFQAFTGQ